MLQGTIALNSPLSRERERDYKKGTADKTLRSILKYNVIRTSLIVSSLVDIIRVYLFVLRLLANEKRY